MPELFTARLTRRELGRAPDMLRFDGAHDARELSASDGSFLLELDFLTWTYDRWDSFGVNPSVDVRQVSQHEFSERTERARGFTNALRAAWSFSRAQRKAGDDFEHLPVEGECIP